MMTTIQKMRLTIIKLLKASLGALALIGTLPTTEANTKIDPGVTERMEDIRLRLLQVSETTNKIVQEDNNIGTGELIAWNDWPNWPNYWRNY